LFVLDDDWNSIDVGEVAESLNPSGNEEGIVVESCHRTPLSSFWGRGNGNASRGIYMSGNGKLEGVLSYFL